ncbi:MAG: Maf family protein [Planctomycetota bacterium]
MAPVLLASRSPRRADLCRRAGIPFELVAPGAEPAPAPDEEPAAYCRRAAVAKAAGARLGAATGLLLAVDTVVVVDGRVLGKPADRAEAEAFLDLLGGREHEVLTGHALAEVVAGRAGPVAYVEARARVAVARLDPAELRRPLAGRDQHDKAGGYGIQADAAGFHAARRRGPSARSSACPSRPSCPGSAGTAWTRPGRSWSGVPDRACSAAGDELGCRSSAARS